MRPHSEHDRQAGLFLSALVILITDGGTPRQPTRPPSELFGSSSCFVRASDRAAPSHVAIGEPALQGLSLPGRVWVFSGTTLERLCVLSSRLGSASFGSECEDVGDQNGDGVSDVAVSAPDTAWEQSGPPRVEIVSLVDGSCIRTLASEANETEFGTTVVNVGDVDGDGADDLLVRAVLQTRGHGDHPRFVLFSGKSAGRIAVIDGAKWNVRSHGRPACRLPDLDGDGVPEFALTLDGAVRVYSGKGCACLFQCESSKDIEDFGHALCAVGDVDGDGTRDFAIGCPYRAKQLGGSIRIRSGKTGDELSLIRGEDAQEAGFGYAMDAFRDFDGDGVEDLLTCRYHWLSSRWMVLSTTTGTRLLPSGRLTGPVPEAGWRLAVDRSGQVEHRFLASCFSFEKWSGDQGVHLYSGVDGSELHAWTLASVRASTLK
jgi:hypothetical protein